MSRYGSLGGERWHRGSWLKGRRLFSILVSFGLIITVIIVIVTIANHSQPEHASDELAFTDFTRLHSSFTQSTQSVLNDLETYLDPMLVVRVPETPAHDKVQKFIKDHYRELGWEIEEDKFTADTPKGKKKMNNIIAHYNRGSRYKLLMAAHYDSKVFDEGEFIGATDSSASVAIMMYISKVLQERWSRPEMHWVKQKDLSVSMAFFDGEEAFVRWTKDDSVYGSKHLVQTWDSEKSPSGSGTRLQEVSLLFLLDLIGAKDHGAIRFGQGGFLQSFFRDTDHIHHHLIDIERRLNGLMTTSETGIKYMGQNKRYWYKGVDDDFRPFREKHIITYSLMPYPFPDVWHKLSDNRDALDMNSIVDYSKLLSAFVMEYIESQS